MAGLANRMEEYSRLAVELAVEVRHRLAPQVFAAAAIAKHSLAQAEEAVRAATQTGLAIQLGVDLRPQGKLRSGATPTDFIVGLDQEGLRNDGLNIRCTPPATIANHVPALRDAFAGLIGAYAKSATMAGAVLMRPCACRTRRCGDLVRAVCGARS